MDKFKIGAARLAEFDAIPQRQLAIDMLTDFRLYVEWIHLQAYGCPFIFEEVHYRIIQALQDFADGKYPTRNIAINVMPGSGKTSLTQYWISWCFARCRSSMFLYVNAIEAIAKELSANTRDILLLPAWQRLYGVEIDNSKLSGSQTSKTRWSLKNGGLNSGLIARTISSNLLGLNAGNPNADGFPGCVICDDPQGFSIVTQEYEREQTKTIYKGSVESRRRSTEVGTVLVQQRLHIDDLTGYLKRTEPEKWTFISVPALLENSDGTYSSSCPRVKSVEELLEMREKDPYIFYSMYQQEPIVYGGEYFHESDFQFYQTLPKFQFTFVATDFAFKKEEKNDRTVLMHLGMGEDNCLYLLKMEAFREDAIGVKQRLIDFCDKAREFDPLMTMVVVETSIANTAFIPSIAYEHPYLNFIEFRKGGMNNKVQYIKATREFFLAKKIFFPENPKPQSLIDEILMFTADGAIGHDDQIDCLAQGVHWVYREMNSNSIFI